MINQDEITFNPSRDGYPGVAVAFVIDGEVVYTTSFKPSFAEEYILSSPVFSSEIIENNGEQKEYTKIQTEYSVEKVLFNEQLTAVLLSEPTIVRLTMENGKHVSVGWKYDSKGFYVNFTRDQNTVRYNGNGTYGE